MGNCLSPAGRTLLFSSGRGPHDDTHMQEILLSHTYSFFFFFFALCFYLFYCRRPDFLFLSIILLSLFLYKCSNDISLLFPIDKNDTSINKYNLKC